MSEKLVAWLTAGAALVLAGAVADAATFTVTNTNNAGAGSLRRAIVDANATAGDDVIDITLLAGSVIAPTAALPAIEPATPSDLTTIQSTDRISLSGENLTGTVTGLELRGNGCVVRGINIVNWGGYGVYVSGANYRISSCFIGTDGASALPNGLGGILIDNVEGGVIGRSDSVGVGNFISGNGGSGILVNASSGSGLAIGGNAIGTNIGGTVAIPNGEDGVSILGGVVRVGGAPVAERNVISGNTGNGISVSGGSDIEIRNNRIGVALTGTAALPNGSAGILVGSGVTGLSIGGLLPAQSNIIAGNAGNGILSEGSGVTVLGNRIGTDSTGTSFVPNGTNGIQVMGGAILIGGTDTGAVNLVAGNTTHGVAEVGSTALIVVQQNSIYGNGAAGLDLNPANTNATASPNVLCLAPLSGTAPANAVVEIFTDADAEGQTYLESATADALGNWSSSLDLSIHAGLNLTLTATVSGANTSRFSDPVVIPASLEPCAVEGEGIGDGEGFAEGEGLAEGEGEGEEEFPPLDRCAAETLGGQRPMNVSHPNVGVYVSDDNGVFSGETFTEDLRFDKFSGVSGAIGGLRWWGVGISPFLSECDRAGGSYRISFYADSPSSPGAEVVSFEVTPQRADTGFVYSGLKIYQHQVVFAEPVELSAGWISVAGIGDEECRFGWYRSDQGDSNHYRITNSSSNGANGDFSFCFLPFGFEIPEGEGVADGEGVVEGTDEGVMEGLVEGVTEGIAEGVVEGVVEGIVEGVNEGVVEGVADGEGATEGEGITEGEGEGVLEGEGASEGSTEGEYLQNCPAGVTSSQPPAPLDSPNSGVYGSDVLMEDYRIERFSGATSPTSVVRWWGVGIDVNTFVACERTNTEFTLRFYEGSDFTRGDLVSEQTVTASQESTGEQVSGRPLFRYRAELPVAVALSDGWLSIQGSGDAACAFYWYRSDVGNGEHIRASQSLTTPSVSGDLSYCLVPAFERLPGHSADQNSDSTISLAELLRVVQLYNSGGLRCDTASEDGYAPVDGAPDTDCPPHASDYLPRDWSISLSELLRLIQLYSVDGFSECEAGEDGFCAATSK